MSDEDIQVSRSTLEKQEIHWQNQSWAKQVEVFLRGMYNVAECVVDLREDRLIAYVVPFGLISPRELLKRLHSQWGEALPPLHCQTIAYLPLTAMGQIDFVALRQMAVLDEELILQWQTHFQKIAGVTEVAVMLQPQPVETALLHLGDLLPEIAQPINVPLHSPAPPPSTTTTSAFVDGGSFLNLEQAPTTLAALLPWAASQFPDQGLTYILSDQNILLQTYSQLLEQACCLLTALRTASLPPQSPVLLILQAPHQLLPAFWACVLGGFQPVILPVPPSFQPGTAHIDTLVQLWPFLSQPAILCNYAMSDRLAVLFPAAKLLIFEQMLLHPPTQDFASPDPQAIAFINLTSGSTGTPKCVPLTHRNLLARARGANLLCQHCEKDIILNWLPFEHIGSISDWHIRAMVTGCRMIYATKETVLGAPLRWLELIDRYRISHSWAPNFAYALVNQALRQQPSGHSWDLSCLKMLLTAGEAVATLTVQEFNQHLERFGLAKTVIRPAFGMAEVGSGITYFVPSVDQALIVHNLDKVALDNGQVLEVPADQPTALQLMDLGAPIAGMQLRIVNEHNQLLQERQVGRLQLKGDALFAGYLHNPHASQQVLLPDGWFDSGDLAFLSLGHLVVVARHKETIILNGANYYSHDIERIVETVPGVEVSFTAACGVRPVGAQQEKLAIFFVPSGTTGELLALVQAVRREVVQRLGVEVEYLLPVQKETIAKTAIGKIQRRQLQKRFEAGEFAGVIKQTDLLLGNQNTTGDWFFRKSWHRRLPTFSEANLNGSVLVFADQTGLAEGIITRLRRCIKVDPGEQFERLGARHYRIAPDQPADYKQLLAALQHEGIQIASILHLWSYGEKQIYQNAAELSTAQAFGLQSLMALAQSLAADLEPSRLPLHIVSSHLQSVLLEDHIDFAKGTLLGFLQSARQELPWLDCRHIDLPMADSEINLEMLWQELWAVDCETEVAYRQGERWVARLQKLDMLSQPKQPFPLDPQKFYLITGGLEGIGLEVSRYLLAHCQLRLLFVEPSFRADQRETLTSLTGLGGELAWEALDPGDPIALQSAVARSMQIWGVPFDGIFHLSQNYRECLIAEETPVQVAAYLDPQLRMSWAFHQLLQAQSAPFYMHLGSASNQLGGILATSFAAAQSFASTFAQFQRLSGIQHSYCLSFGLWDDLEPGCTYPWRSLAAERGYRFLSGRSGLQALLVALTQRETHLWIGIDVNSAPLRRFYLDTPRPLYRLLAYYRGEVTFPLPLQELSDRFGTQSTCHCLPVDVIPRRWDGLVEQALTKPPKMLPTLPRSTTSKVQLDQAIAEIWQQVLEVDRVGLEESFFDLGGHSILLVQVQQRLSELLNRDIALVELFTYPTVGSLAQFLGQSGVQAAFPQSEARAKIRQRSVQRQQQLRLNLRQNSLQEKIR